MPAVRRLVYASRISAPSGVCSPERLQAILRASVRNNTPVGVTGMLLSFRGYFVQVLEGPAPAVELTFGRVAKDMRHGAVTVLSDEADAARAFPDWAMCGKDITEVDNEILDVLSRREAFNPYAMGGRDVIRLLKLVHTIHLRATAPSTRSEVVEL